MTEVSHVTHLALRYSHVRECVENQETEVLYVPSPENKADSLTKALPDDTAEQHRKCLKIADVTLWGCVGIEGSD